VTERALSIPLTAELVDAIAAVVLERVRAEVFTFAQSANGRAPRWLYGAKAAADYLELPLGKVQKLTAAGAIPCRRVDAGQRCSYRTDELDAWLDEFYEGPRLLRSA